MQITEAHGAVM